MLKKEQSRHGALRLRYVYFHALNLFVLVYLVVLGFLCIAKLSPVGAWIV